ncbi:MAG: acetyl-CoA carboxylase biotin carboxyl carrier protein [Proteobacteria bacterium]|nr:acetyl-CoA carboxylase biotin carboxyl carrier protein [Pseudomonadota bacterium]
MSSEKESKPFLIDAKAVRTLARILNETNLSEIEYELDSGRIKVVRTGASQITQIPSYSSPHHVSISPSSVPEPSENLSIPPSHETDWSTHPGVLKSPLVGTAYLSSQPGADPFIKEGDQVPEGHTLLILEAMKVMNPIRAPKSGKILKILVQNAQPVEFGEPLVVIE